MSKETDETIDDFDQTNGLAPGLEGDADEPGHDPDEPSGSVFADMVDEVTNGFEEKTTDRSDEADET